MATRTVLSRDAARNLREGDGCLEQTLSSAWPFLVLPEAVAKVNPLLVDSHAAKDKTDSAIVRIQSMQLYDGSFTMWPGGTSTYAWGVA